MPNPYNLANLLPTEDGARQQAFFVATTANLDICSQDKWGNCFEIRYTQSQAPDKTSQGGMLAHHRLRCITLSTVI